jgi:hypothetical protein
LVDPSFGGASYSAGVDGGESRGEILNCELIGTCVGYISGDHTSEELVKAVAKELDSFAINF